MWRVAVLLAVLTLVGVLFLAGFPARAYLAQRHDRQRLASYVSSLTSRNRALDERVHRLGTDEEIERLAREQYGLVRPGEEAFVIVPDSSPGGAPPARQVAPPNPRAG